jgi:hypothetical protein
MGGESFDQLVDFLDNTMFVVTPEADGEPSGCLVGFGTQASIHPHRFLAGISRTNHTCRIAARSDYLAVHVLQRRHIDLARLFGGETGDQVNKFDLCSWRADGVPGLPQSRCILVPGAGGLVPQHWCLATAGRYLIKTIARQLDTADQQVAAQYRILALATHAT